MKNISKGFKICIIINLVFIMLFMLSLLISFVSGLISSILVFLLKQITYLSAIISFIVATVFAFTANDKNLKKQNAKIWIIFLIIMIVITCFPIVKPNFYKIEAKKDIKNIVNKINNLEENRYVYLYDDLVNFDNNIEGKYDKGSYIVKYNNEFNFCLSRGNTKLEGLFSNLEQNKVNVSNGKCQFSFYVSLDKNYNKEYDLGEIYLAKYIEDKYNIHVLDVRSEQDCMGFNCSEKYYVVETVLGKFNAYLEVVDNKIIETDKYEQMISNLNDKEE